MRQRLRRLAGRDQRGVTLAELTIVLGLFGMVMTGIIMIYQKTQEVYFQGAEMAELQGNIRVALDQIAHDLHKAGRDITGVGFNPSTPGCPDGGGRGIPIHTATSTTIRVRMDNNDDQDCADAEEDVTFNYDSTTKVITRATTVGGTTTTSTLAEQVDIPGGTSVFTYWTRPVLTGAPNFVCGAGALTATIAPSQGERACTQRVTVNLRGLSVVGADTVTRTVQLDIDLRAR